jgi:hypothetical protein
MRIVMPSFAVLLLAAAAVAGPTSRLRAADMVEDTGTVSLEDRLKAGLKARRPEDEEFLEQVAHMVETGLLPRKLVDSTYVWAIRRRQDVPFPAFERALRMQAERLGVEF